ncbi:tryptophan synthase subunit alpha [Caldibacillus lycopersici]|uniref:Tryptophan synthase alpha chain n=1 Tax=Perspicuibacillus lycopersici TaxID=1325689 RepID=A0AAE3LL69_9BACI|nr:tryptophan synthase subunit alpha [Perspicuibacillus lycopersici]MCU9612025.1 tryptophan synthase subunit alpha [Perspicuibacillus lycopersici]
MNRFEKAFIQLKENEEKAFVPYIMAGDGGISVLKERLLFLEENGATAIEVGIPFSDPVADGPTIQEASQRALQNGTTLKLVLEELQSIRPFIQIPIIIMTYMNPIYAYGLPEFITDAQKAGIDGCIIPDLPMEEENVILPFLSNAGIEIIRLVTLTSPTERIAEIAKKGKGFLYAVTITGITGSRSSFQTEVGAYLNKIKKVSPIPVLAGFGISSPEHVKALSHYCDGVVVGSKIVDLFHNRKAEEIIPLMNATKKINAK